EHDRDGHHDFNRLAVQLRRTVKPLTDRAQGGVVQERLTRDNSSVADGAVFSDASLDGDVTLNTGGAGDLWVDWVDEFDSLRFADFPAHDGHVGIRRATYRRARRH